MNTEKKGLRRFLFLEFLDPEINALLTCLQRAFGDNENNTGIHITVRGPYYSSISGKHIEKFERIVQRDPILIHGIGMFRNPEKNVVFIRVHSDALKNIWWKPDYPRSQYGFNPHISLYRTSDVDLASVIVNFLDKEGIKLICHDFRLVMFSSKQGELFPFRTVPTMRSFPELSNRLLVRSDIVQRAAKLMEEYRRSRVDDSMVAAT